MLVASAVIAVLLLGNVSIVLAYAVRTGPGPEEFESRLLPRRNQEDLLL